MIPYDATQHIQGISAGVKDAMPSLIKAGEARKPGNPDMEGYLNSKFAEFERRRLAGEDPNKITEDLMQDFQQNMSGGPGTVAYAEQQGAALPSVGVNNGITSLGDANMQSVTSSPPNSFGGGSFNGLTPPPAAMGGGISGNTVGGGATPVQNTPQVNFTPQGALPADNMGASVTGEKVSSMPGSASFEKPMEQPIPYEEKPRIDFTKREAGNTMQTGHGSPIPPMRTRGEQEQAMSDIERMSKVDNAETSLNIKQQQLQFKTQLDMIKTRAKELRLSEKDKAMILLSFKGLNAKEQMFVASEWARKLNNDQKFKLGTDKNRIAADKQGQALPPALKHLWDRYTNATGEIKSYYNSLDPNTKGKPERIKQLKMVAANELHEYNKAAIEAGLPIRTAEDLNVKEVYGDNDPNNKVEE